MNSPRDGPSLESGRKRGCDGHPGPTWAERQGNFIEMRMQAVWFSQPTPRVKSLRSSYTGLFSRRTKLTGSVNPHSCGSMVGVPHRPRLYPLPRRTVLAVGLLQRQRGFQQHEPLRLDREGPGLPSCAHWENECSGRPQPTRCAAGPLLGVQEQSDSVSLH